MFDLNISVTDKLADTLDQWLSAEIEWEGCAGFLEKRCKRVALSRSAVEDNKRPGHFRIWVRFLDAPFTFAGKQYDLMLECVEKESGLLGISLRKELHSNSKRTNEVVHEVRLSVDSNGWGEPVPIAVLDEVQKLPAIRLGRTQASISKAVEKWLTFFRIEEKYANERAFDTRFSACRLEDLGKQVRLHLNVPDEIDEKQLAKIERIRARRDSIRLRGNDQRVPDHIGIECEFVRIEKSRIVLGLDRESAEQMRLGRIEIPAQGVVFNDASALLSQIEIQRTALRRMNGGEALLTAGNLEEILFGTIEELALAPLVSTAGEGNTEWLSTNINVEQKAAVVSALNTPDVLLIQGPPGTGKTTVIAELCFQLAKRGKRVLVTSQANLAVDNALSRLELRPEILALRVGRAGRIEQEGQDFVEERAVRRWLRSIAAGSRRRYEAIRSNFELAEFFSLDYERVLKTCVEHFAASD